MTLPSPHALDERLAISPTLSAVLRCSPLLTWLRRDLAQDGEPLGQDRAMLADFEAGLQAGHAVVRGAIVSPLAGALLNQLMRFGNGRAAGGGHLATLYGDALASSGLPPWAQLPAGQRTALLRDAQGLAAWARAIWQRVTRAVDAFNDVPDDGRRH